jgi:hypothetical protein
MISHRSSRGVIHSSAVPQTANEKAKAIMAAVSMVLSGGLVALRFDRRTPPITRLPPSDIDLQKRPIRDSGALVWYARHGH